MGKTETIKKRAIWVYAPSIEQRELWERIASDNGMPLSKWIVNTIEDSVLERENKAISRKDVEEENRDLRKNISDLQNKLHQVMIIRDSLEKEIRRYRAEPFLETGFEGIRRFDKELILLLKNAKTVDGKFRFVSNDEILSRLGIDFLDTVSIKAISNQLSRLEGYGLIMSGSKGWRWKE